MGADPALSVVDEDGEVWGTERLFVLDASVFPTASGANPMVTTLAIAHMLATRLAGRLAAGFHGGEARRRRRALAATQRRWRARRQAAAAVAATAEPTIWQT